MILAFILPVQNIQSQDLQDIMGQLGAGSDQRFMNRLINSIPTCKWRYRTAMDKVSLTTHI